MLKTYLLSSVFRAAGAEPSGGGAPAAPAAPATPSPAPSPGLAAPAAGAPAGEQPPPAGQTPPAAPADPLDVVPEDPARYEFKVPDGMAVDQNAIDAFKPLAKELNLTPKQAQRIVDLQADVVRRGLEGHAAMVAKWEQDARTDAEIGGPKFDQNLQVAKRGLEAVGSPELRTLFLETGIGNHPAILRAFAKIGRLVGEGQQPPSGAPSNSGKSAAEVLYGGS